MNIIRKLIVRAGVFRWECFAILSVCIVMVFLWYCVYPLGASSWKQCAGLGRQIRFLREEKALPVRYDSVKRYLTILDSLIQLSRKQLPYNESEALKKIYAAGDSSGLLVAKVQINEPIVISQGKEIPVVVTGAGSYPAIGRFISIMENADYRIRIRQLSLRNGNNDKGSLSCDFLIMESN